MNEDGSSGSLSAISLYSSHTTLCDSDTDTCWICLEDCDEGSSCNCSNASVHKQCLARWQLRKAGTPEEKFCRLCSGKLDDWRYIIRPNYDDYMNTIILINCTINGITMSIPITKEMSKEDFKIVIMACAGIVDERLLPSITFAFDVPDENKSMTVNGFECFDAMLFCTRVTKVENNQNRRLLQHPNHAPLTAPDSQTTTQTTTHTISDNQHTPTHTSIEIQQHYPSTQRSEPISGFMKFLNIIGRVFC
jgi:hypothetical protein